MAIFLTELSLNYRQALWPPLVELGATCNVQKKLSRDLANSIFVLFIFMKIRQWPSAQTMLDPLGSE